MPKSTSSVAYDCGGAANVGDAASSVCTVTANDNSYLGLTDTTYTVGQAARDVFSGPAIGVGTN